MPSFATRTVTSVLDERRGLQRVLLDDASRRLRPHRADRAGRGGRSGGGQHHGGRPGPGHRRLARRALEPGSARPGAGEGPGHIMKLRYTSLQTDTGVAEEDHASELAGVPDLAGCPVVACGLHSQVALRGRGGEAPAAGGPRGLRDDRGGRPPAGLLRPRGRARRPRPPRRHGHRRPGLRRRPGGRQPARRRWPWRRWWARPTSSWWRPGRAWWAPGRRSAPAPWSWPRWSTWRAPWAGRRSSRCATRASTSDPVTGA